MVGQTNGQTGTTDRQADRQEVEADKRADEMMLFEQTSRLQGGQADKLADGRIEDVSTLLASLS